MQPHPATPSVAPLELSEELKTENPPVVIDVREDDELAIAALPGVTHIPLATLPHHLPTLDKDGDYVMMCHGGTRSGHATRYMLEQGFTKVRNLSGGISAWSVQVDPSVPRY